MPPHALPHTRRRADAVADFSATALLGAFALLKTYALAPALSDEYIYFYMCRRITEGAVPYRDFFFAHPPLHLLPGTLLLALFSFSVPLAKAVPAVSSALAGIAVYRAARRSGPVTGLVALGLFLFSYDALRSSSHYTGACEATALLAWAAERSLAGRPATSGLLAASAALIAFYAVPPAAALGVVLLLRRDGSAGRYAAACATVFLGVNLLCLGAFGRDYWDPVVRYHFLKPRAGDGQSGAILWKFAAENPWILWSAPALLLARFAFRRSPAPEGTGDPGGSSDRSAGAARDDPWTPAAAGILMAAFHLSFLAAFSRIFTYYILPAIPGLALAGAFAYPEAIRGSGRALRGGRPRQAAAVAAGIAILIGPAALRLAGARIRAGEPNAAGPVRFVWRNAPLPNSLNAAVRSTLWREDANEGSWSLSITRYLQHESLRFEAPAYLARRVRALTAEGSTIFGDSLTVPLVALLSDRRVASDEADTNYMRFTSGITPPGREIALLESAPPEAIIVSPFRGLSLIPEISRWIPSKYHLAETFQDPLYGPHLLYLKGPQ